MAKTAALTRKDVSAQLIAFLTKPQAHITLDGALNGLPASMRGKIPEGMPYSIWQLVEHLRIAQRDILLFSQNSDGQGGKYSAPKWPDDYWVEERAPRNPAAWKASLTSIASDLEEFCNLLSDKKSDLMKKFPWGEGQNLMREALLIGDHNAYHIGEVVAVRRALGCWKKQLS